MIKPLSIFLYHICYPALFYFLFFSQGVCLLLFLLYYYFINFLLFFCCYFCLLYFFAVFGVCFFCFFCCCLKKKFSSSFCQCFSFFLFLFFSLWFFSLLSFNPCLSTFLNVYLPPSTCAALAKRCRSQNVWNRITEWCNQPDDACFRLIPLTVQFN